MRKLQKSKPIFIVTKGSIVQKKTSGLAAKEILELIQKKYGISNAEISRQTGLTGATIGNLLDYKNARVRTSSIDRIQAAYPDEVREYYKVEEVKFVDASLAKKMLKELKKQGFKAPYINQILDSDLIDTVGKWNRKKDSTKMPISELMPLVAAFPDLVFLMPKNLNIQQVETTVNNFDSSSLQSDERNYIQIMSRYIEKLEQENKELKTELNR